ncbi:MAG TPA: hypothetical protein VMP01_08570 [Pirellulaceae bacterium]|nr:hypothetical protein [Pirellulaceae bacterium]
MERYLLLIALVLYVVYLKLAPWLYRLTPEELASLKAKHQQKTKTGVIGGLLGMCFVLSIIGVSFAGGIYVGNGIYAVVKSKYWLAGNPLCLVEPTSYVIHLSVGWLIFIGVSLISLLVASCLHDDFREYLEICAAATGYRVVPVLLWTVVPWLLFTCVFLVLACDNFAAVFPNKVVLNGFWTVGSVAYRYEDVVAVEERSIRRTDNNRNVRNITAWDIKFADGRVWSTQSNIAVQVNPRQRQSHEDFARIISERSGRKIVKAADRR